MIFSILSVFCLTLTQSQNETNLNLPYADERFLVIDNRPNCIALSSYFAINFTAQEQKSALISYRDLTHLVKNRFNNTHCSLNELQHFLKQFKIKSKIIKLKNKKDITDPKFKFFILYIPPKENSRIGHFTFCSNSDKNVYVWDPMLTSALKSNLNNYPNIMTNWDGVMLWIK